MERWDRPGKYLRKLSLIKHYNLGHRVLCPRLSSECQPIAAHCEKRILIIIIIIIIIIILLL